MKPGSGASPLFRTAAVLAALLGLSARGSPAQPPEEEAEQAPQLSCYDLVKQKGFTDEHLATQLCQGARSTAPAKCYLRLQNEGSLTDSQVLQLCQYATPEDDPAGCYIQAREKSFIETWRGVQLCQPPIQELLRYCPRYVY
ncbi:hypothetical protein JY651_20760 [Pyxidicoccus parkwayensis]|uniref:Uncharacterized protein n=1 Tax=Pyxidicoccus parkwayensis TaxID=2813578 RepID=A0ABX7P9U5_9BACT|nr:hypothetical protein [Pyxidicoccus parkwaysis]QSQ27193.1 hypothetical protein JY651_20760 [Pyxidicoccus parkwaysis]